LGLEDINDEKNKDAGAYKVEYLLKYLSAQPVYYDVVIASNLGVNDLNYVDVEKASSSYISAYTNLLNFTQSVFVNGKKVNSSWRKRDNVINVDFYFVSINPIDEKLLNACDKSNTRTTSKIVNYNKKMSDIYGKKYLDSYSKYNDWFAQTIKNGQARFLYKKCVDKNGNSYTCEDGLHYSEYMEKTYIYEFYKSKLLS
jgi:hypothetical protein